MYLIPLNYAVKMVEMVNFIICIVKKIFKLKKPAFVVFLIALRIKSVIFPNDLHT